MHSQCDVAGGLFSAIATFVMEGEQSKNANQGHPLDGRWTQQGHGQGSVELDRYRSISGL